MNHPHRLLTTSAVIGLALLASTLTVSAASGPPASDSSTKPPVLTGQAAFTDAAHEAPGTRRHLTAADLPQPMPEQSVDNGPTVVPRPEGAWPIAPKGFKVELYTTGLDNPRLIRFAPNGDLFLAESQSGTIKIFRGVDAGGANRSKSPYSPQISTSHSESPSIPLGPQPGVGLHRRHR